MAGPISTIIFDLDGTLLDTLEDIANAMNRVLLSQGLPAHPIEAYKGFVGAGATVLAQRAIPENLRTEQDIQRIKALFIEDYRSNWDHKTRLYPGIDTLLNGLSSMGIRFCVLSNKPQYFTEACVNRYLDTWPFEMILGEQEGMAKKPDPEGVFNMMNTLDLRPQEILFLGDTGIDMLTAKRAGVFPCGCLWGFRQAEELLSCGAKALIKSPEELFRVLKEIAERSHLH